jgi:hypothetical protein
VPGHQTDEKEHRSQSRAEEQHPGIGAGDEETQCQCHRGQPGEDKEPPPQRQVDTGGHHQGDGKHRQYEIPAVHGDCPSQIDRDEGGIRRAGRYEDQYRGEQGGVECHPTVPVEPEPTPGLAGRGPPSPQGRQDDRDRRCDDEDPPHHRILGERVDRPGGPGSGQVDPEDGQSERQRGEHAIPSAQPAGGLFHPGGMDEDRGGEPGHECGVLDRVPGPVPAPSQLHVGPVGPGSHAKGEQGPRRVEPATHPSQPEIAVSPTEKVRSREGERHDQDGQPQVEDGRVIDHGRVLQDRQQADAVDCGDVGDDERIGQKSGDDRQPQSDHRRRPDRDRVAQRKSGDR